MPRFSIAWLLTMTLLISVVVFATLTKLENNSLQLHNIESSNERQELVDNAKRLEDAIVALEEERNDSYAGTALITQILKEPVQNQQLIEQLSTIPSGLVNCSVRDFPDMPSVRMFMFSERIVEPIIGGRIVRPKLNVSPSVCILVATDTNEIVDSVYKKGLGGISYVYSNPWLVGWTHSDGSVFEVKVTETGFKPQG